MRTIPEVFAARVAENPDAIALIHDDQRLTYRELDQRAEQLAAHLRARLTQPESLVGLSIVPSIGMVVALLGMLRAGGVVVPLDPEYPAERLHYLISDSGLKWIVADTESAPRLAGQPAETLVIDALPEAPPTVSPSPLEPRHLAFCLYTSGSTGQPKGVLIEHQALTAHCQAMLAPYEFHAADRALLFASLNYVAALEQVFLPLLNGASLGIRERELWQAPAFAAKIRESGITVADLPPGYLHGLLESLDPTTDVGADFPLRLIIVGGEEIRPETVALWQQSPLRDLRLINAYGMTETPVTAAWFDIPAHGAFDRVPIGRAAPHWRVVLLDESLQPVAEGEEGEICISGPGLARGYLHRLDLSARKFIPDPAGEGRLYRTGDVGRFLPDGNLQYLGRQDHQVQIRGFRVELGEIEATLPTHPEVREAAVITQGEGSAKRLLAFVVPRHPETIDGAVFPAELRAFLRAKLPPHMVPDQLVLLATMLTTPNGKVDRQGLMAFGRKVPSGAFRVRLSAYGSPDNLELAPCAEASPEAGQILVETQAASLNFRDALNALGMLRDYNAEHLGIGHARDVPFGYECAGVVREVGTAVTEYRVGDEVIVYALGSLASHVRVEPRCVAPKPSFLDFATAASLPTVFLTVFYGLKELAGIRAGDKILIHAAAGGVGQAAVQLAQWVGAEIYATASPGKWAFLKSQGIQHVMNSRTLEFADQLAASGTKMDLVINGLNGEFIDKSFEVLGPGGRFVELGKIDIRTPEQVAERRPDVSYFAFDLGDIIDHDPALVARMMREVVAGFEAGQLTAPPIKTFSITQVAEAFRFLSQAKHIGKVVVSFAQGIENPLPVIAETVSDQPVTLPRTPTEQTIAQLWREVLGLPQCDVQTSFFELGGNSLLALEFMGRLTNTLGVSLPMQTLLEHNTVETLASQVDIRRAPPDAENEGEYEEGFL